LEEKMPKNVREVSEKSNIWGKLVRKDGLSETDREVYGGKGGKLRLSYKSGAKRTSCRRFHFMRANGMPNRRKKKNGALSSSGPL